MTVKWTLSSIFCCYRPNVTSFYMLYLLRIWAGNKEIEETLSFPSLFFLIFIVVQHHSLRSPYHLLDHINIKGK